MSLKISKKLIFVALLIIAVSFGAYYLFPRNQVDYSTQVKPILNKNCIACHGGVKKQGGFSVLFREEALAKGESGRYAIIPGDPDNSEMMRRVTLDDPEERMPYKHDPLSKEEISILRRWIKQGAKWGEHWAYVAVQKMPVPELSDSWIKNDIDKFILDKLEEKKLNPSQQADKPTLLRRVSLDLIGMLPDKKLADQFLNSKDSNAAYETLVDSLLASPRYGEKWASMWLDLARYADTKGYESDGGRNIWEYRDWVIRAFNEDKPYDQFITEQIAGDLLPNPTDAQYIATGFHRNTMNNDEGGTDNEEFRTAAVMDRVSTTWEALMSTTFACVQCHSHPYDPFRHEEYYQFMAFFNNTRDEDVPGEYPLLKKFNDTVQRQVDDIVKWVKEKAGNEEAKKALLYLKTGEPAINSSTADSMINAAVGNGNWGLFMRDRSQARFKKVMFDNATQLAVNYTTNHPGGVLKFHLDSPAAIPFYTWQVPVTKNYQYVRAIMDIPAQKGIHDLYLTYQKPGDTSLGRQFLIFFDNFAFLPFPGMHTPGFAENKKEFEKIANIYPPSTPVMVENPEGMRRKTHVFERGNWTAKGEEVQAGVPKLLSYAMPADAPKNRLGMAMWLTNKKNPLVSRTIVNRLWEQLFGTGIVETLEDMGTQGLSPTHKELLDFLAWQMMNDKKWSLKQMIKEMVMSATYRQDSRMTEELKGKDFFNKYYARGPRLRLSAEQLRDQHLCISGTMSDKMYGQGVMPWQPDGIWLSPYNGARWQNSTGEDQYRRAIYTYWKRTSPYPSAIAFDAPQRNVCSPRRIRTNTPLQALATLNDSAYLNLARHFAYRMQQEAGSNYQQQIAKGYELMLYKKIPAGKLNVFDKLYQQALKEYAADKDKACEMVGMNDEHNNPETAALIVVANALLNLDEVVMKN